MDSSPYANGEFSYAINLFTISNLTQDNNIVGNNESSIMNIISSYSKQINNYPFDDPTQNHLWSQEQSMMGIQLENENYESNSKQSLQHDISSLVYGNW